MLDLVRSFSYTPRAGFSEEFLLHSSSWFYWGFSFTLLILVLVRNFSYTPDASFSEEFLLHSSSWFQWGVSFTLLMLDLVRSFSYTPRGGFGEEFLLHSSIWFQWGVSFTLLIRVSFSKVFYLTLLVLVLVRSLFYTLLHFYTPDTCFTEEFPLHFWCKF